MKRIIHTPKEYLGEWEEGDILEDKIGDETKILGICGEIYLVSAVNDFSAASSHNYTKKDLKVLGYKLIRRKN